MGAGRAGGGSGGDCVHRLLCRDSVGAHFEGEGRMNFLSIQPTEGIFIRWSKGYRWQPQADITVYELALCVGPLATNSPEGVEALPPEAKRHFVEITSEE